MKSDPTPENDTSTPGRPKDEGSRQQTHPDQSSQTGSPDLDKELTPRTGEPKQRPTRTA